PRPRPGRHPPARGRAPGSPSWAAPPSPPRAASSPSAAGATMRWARPAPRSISQRSTPSTRASSPRTAGRSRPPVRSTRSARTSSSAGPPSWRSSSGASARISWVHTPEASHPGAGTVKGPDPRGGSGMAIAAPTADELALLQDEAVRFTRELIRIDTTNYGGNDPETWGKGETEAANHVVAALREVGLEPAVYESHPGRPSVLVTIPGQDRTRGGLILHGHLDVVPARAEDWTVDPFAAEIIDGMIYGRGAVDMKDMVGMILAVARHLARTRQVPPRDLMFAFFADEENASVWGAQWLVENHPELFDGMTEAISEVGG